MTDFDFDPVAALDDEHRAKHFTDFEAKARDEFEYGLAQLKLMFDAVRAPQDLQMTATLTLEGADDDIVGVRKQTKVSSWD